jgi:1-phosphatidylinositol phosphodiesterase
LYKGHYLTRLRYEIPSFLSIPEKVELATKILVTPNDMPTTPTLAISFFSAASFPLALPTTVARGFGWPQAGFGVEGVNSRLGSWLIRTLTGKTTGEKGSAISGPKVKGWTLMDFFEDPEDCGVIPLLIECNFRGT